LAQKPVKEGKGTSLHEDWDGQAQKNRRGKVNAEGEKK